MIVEPKVRGFICTTAHPVGCEKNVTEQMDYVLSQGKIDGPKNVLIIGASTGYGLASRIVSLAGAHANTIGIFYEKEAKGKRTASPGWYNSVAFEKAAKAQGVYAKSINGDAFSNEIKTETINMIKKDLGQIDLVIYSLASPRRVDPTTDTKYMSVLKPIGCAYTNKSIDAMQGIIGEVTLEPATQEEVFNTTKVMGGEDWEMWIDLLLKENLLSDKAKTIAYSYIGPEVTMPIYRDGTIGKAKVHLEETGIKLNEKLKSIHGTSQVVVAKALVTQASSAIPIVPLYIAALYKTMKESGTHEGCIEQITRLFKEFLYEEHCKVDEKSRIRIDDFEMKEDIQEKALHLFDIVTSENVYDIVELEEYQKEFYKLFGFGFADVDYSKDVDVNLSIPSLLE